MTIREDSEALENKAWRENVPVIKPTKLTPLPKETPMSHDRGCWKCGRDPWEYENCVKNVWGLHCAKLTLALRSHEYVKYRPKPRIRVKAATCVIWENPHEPAKT